MKKRIYMTDYRMVFRVVSPDKDGKDPDDPCAEDLKASRSMERKIYNWIKRAVKPLETKRKKKKR